MRIYLDVCCLNRPFDDQSQERVRLETEAVELVFARLEQESHQWVISSAIEAETGLNPDPDRRMKVEAMLQLADERIDLIEQINTLARSLGAFGIRGFDALHMALAEVSRCDYLLTVDDQLIVRAGRINPPMQVRVLNPVQWLMEAGA